MICASLVDYGPANIVLDTSVDNMSVCKAVHENANGVPSDTQHQVYFSL